MSSYSILSDLISLEMLVSLNTTPQQQVAEPDFASLPSLPFTDDDAELQEAISQDQWGDAIASPEKTYNAYQGTVEYFIPDRQDTLILCHRPHTTAEVLFTLEHFSCLRKHLTTNLNLLTKFGEVNLSPPSFQTRRSVGLTTLELAQNSFAIHHIGISETLVDADNLGTLAFGLPAYDDYRLARNYLRMRFRRRKWIRTEVIFRGRCRVRGTCMRGCCAMCKLTLTCWSGSSWTMVCGLAVAFEGV
jgi:hypothetical protein